MQEINQTELTTVIDRLQHFISQGGLSEQHSAEANDLITQLSTLLVK